MKNEKRVLVVDDEKVILMVIKEELLTEGYVVDTATNGIEACRMLERQKYDLVILDNQMPQMTGIEVLAEIKKKYAKTMVIMMTAYGSIDNAVEAMKLGAYDYFTKPFENSELVEKVNQAFDLGKRLTKVKINRSDNEPIIGTSDAFADIQKTIEKIKDLDSTVIVTGENGTGKGVIARKIHELGNRKDKPFIHVNCAALPHNLIESELFGHVRGAFTGASEETMGKFELAGDGIIFLDEIGTLDLSLQAKLLVVLQEKRFEKIGSSTPIKLRARVISATNHNLEEAVQKHEFREDLYYRLNVIHLECPALRYRKNDILELARHFVEKFSREIGKEIQEISPEAMEILLAYKWPGNIRELENTIESAIALSDSKIISVHDLPIRIQRSIEEMNIERGANKNMLENRELQEIKAALERNKGHREKTAAELGISRRTLQYKIKKYDLT